MVGLSNGDTNQNWNDIDFALYTYGGTLMVYEKGTLRGNFGSYSTGDKLRVSVEANVVKYWRNSTLLYSSLAIPSYPLLVDTSLYSQGAIVSNTVLSGNWAGGSPAPSGEQVSWTSVVGATASGGTLTKTAATAWGNAGAVSTKSITAGNNGYVEFTATETNTYRMVGLSNGNTNSNWNDIDFALYAHVGGQVLIYEKGVLRGAVSTYATGDRLRVSVTGGVVTYSKNGTVIYTSAQAPTFPLLVDSSLYTQGATITNATLSGNWQ
jgi:hypothetical protein